MSTYTLQGIAMCFKNTNEWEVNPTLKRKEITPELGKQFINQVPPDMIENEF